MLTSAIILALAGTSLAIPMPKSTVASVSGPGKFSVPVNLKPNFVPNGPAALRRALGKYGFPMPDALSKRQDGSVTASPAGQDVEYTCQVNIGGQTLNLDFDTGSADL